MLRVCTTQHNDVVIKDSDGGIWTLIDDYPEAADISCLEEFVTTCSNTLGDFEMQYNEYMDRSSPPCDYSRYSPACQHSRYNLASPARPASRVNSNIDDFLQHAHHKESHVRFEDNDEDNDFVEVGRGGNMNLKRVNSSAYQCVGRPDVGRVNRANSTFNGFVDNRPSQLTNASSLFYDPDEDFSRSRVGLNGSTSSFFRRNSDEWPGATRVSSVHSNFGGPPRSVASGYHEAFDNTWNLSKDIANGIARRNPNAAMRYTSGTNRGTTSAAIAPINSTSRMTRNTTLGPTGCRSVTSYHSRVSEPKLRDKRSMTLFDRQGRMYLLVSDDEDEEPPPPQRERDDSWMGSIKNAIRSSSHNLFRRMNTFGDGKNTPPSRTTLPAARSFLNENIPCSDCRSRTNIVPVAYRAPSYMTARQPTPARSRLLSRNVPTQATPKTLTVTGSRTPGCSWQTVVDRDMDKFYVSEEVLVDEPDYKRCQINRRFTTPEGTRESSTEYERRAEDPAPLASGVDLYPYPPNNQVSTFTDGNQVYKIHM